MSLDLLGKTVLFLSSHSSDDKIENNEINREGKMFPFIFNLKNDLCDHFPNLCLQNKDF